MGFLSRLPYAQFGTPFAPEFQQPQYGAQPGPPMTMPQPKPPAPQPGLGQRFATAFGSGEGSVFNSPLFNLGLSLLGNAQGSNWGGVAQDMQGFQQSQMERQRLQNEMRRAKVTDAREGRVFDRQQSEWQRQDQQRQRYSDWAARQANNPDAAVNPEAAFEQEMEARALANQPLTPYQQRQLDQQDRIAQLSYGRQNADDVRQDQRLGAQLRNQFQSRHGDFTARRDAYSTLRALENGGQDSDIAFIYTYMKMLDPTSVVREGEFATAQNAGGIPESIRNQYNRVINGRTSLPASVRRGMVETAGRIYETSAEQFERDRQMQLEMGASMGGQIDPTFIAPDLRLPPEAAPQSPPPATSPAPSAAGQGAGVPPGGPPPEARRLGFTHWNGAMWVRPPAQHGARSVNNGNIR